jgi:hypothetical protein
MCAVVGGVFLLVCFAMLYTGKAGRVGDISTLQTNPQGYWYPVIGSAVGGVIIMGYGVYLIASSTDD